MNSNDHKILRFRPELPIYLSTENIGVKTKDEVLFAIQQLRDLGWLCVYSEEVVRPFHMCFLDPKMFQEFKKDAQSLSIKLIEGLINTHEDLDRLADQELEASNIPLAETRETVERGGVIEIIKDAPTKEEKAIDTVKNKAKSKSKAKKK